ncbi:hypothetical protein [Streptomyces sp. NPDC089799]|uniref:hypothetical protein n=1 Tax=Streptomyces sp. NPDC089799 TaxID=3155066 RepID=UPI0034161FE8
MSPQHHPAPTATAAVLRHRYTHRLPSALGDLAGPCSGTVHLPLHLAWSGLRAYDLDRPRQRMSLYRTVLAEGQHDDLTTYLNGDLLAEQWPVLRTLVSRHVRDVWEETFPQLRTRTAAA